QDISSIASILIFSRLRLAGLWRLLWLVTCCSKHAELSVQFEHRSPRIPWQSFIESGEAHTKSIYLITNLKIYCFRGDNQRGHLSVKRCAHH
uniref:Secreted protein n=1 Tax=Oryza glumipatula TaxID=40148 RepID=A0A0D9ZK72_9ORYZ